MLEMLEIVYTTVLYCLNTASGNLFIKIYG